MCKAAYGDPPKIPEHFFITKVSQILYATFWAEDQNNY
jgi:hypothetical protein